MSVQINAEPAIYSSGIASLSSFAGGIEPPVGLSRFCQIAFIDSSLPDIDALLEGLPNVEVFILDANLNGIEQITSVLGQRRNLSSIHIISHGDSGKVLLGNTELSTATLAQYGDRLRNWSQSLTPDADLLFYGCNVAAGEAGKAFIQKVSQLTQADVAASTDLTGRSELNANWELEFTVGSIESGLAISAIAQQIYDHTLAVFTYNGNQYFLTNGAKTWEEAQAEARSRGGNLVTINDAAEQAWLVQTFGGGEGFWIGLTDKDVEGQFRWVSGEPLTYTNWQPGEPNNGGPGGNQDYAWMNYGGPGRWDDNSAFARLRGIIEVSSGGTSSPPADTQAPTATLSAANHATSGNVPYTFTVTYSDNVAVDSASINGSATNSDIRVTNTAGFSELATLVSISPAGNGTPRTATYRITAPGGTWDPSDNGIYTVTLLPNQVRDTSGNFAAGATLGTFQVNVVSGFTYNGNQYFLTNGAKTWEEAQAEARSRGGNLVTINDAAEQAWLVQTFGGGEGFWIGLTDKDVEGQFRWVSGEPLTYTNWQPGEPNNGGPGGNQDYAWMNYGGPGRWDDNSAFARLRGIIEVSSGTSLVSLKDNATIFVNEAAGFVTITAVRTGSTAERLTVEYTTNELGTANTATAGADYTQPVFDGRDNTGQIVFEVGESEATFTIPIVNDDAIESNETFAVGLQNTSSGSLGAPRTVLITIVDDDTPSTFAMTSAAIAVSEGSSSVVVTVQRSGNSSGSATVSYDTVNGTAQAGSDYLARSGTLTFAPGQTAQTISIPIINDTLIEDNESFSVVLSNPTGGVLGSQTASVITILDNDLELGNLVRRTAVSGLTQPTTLDWTPDGRYMLIAQKNGIVRVVDNGILRATPLINISSQVNDTRDRGLLGIAVHPDFPNTPYVYLLYTFDPPETAGRSGLSGRDGEGNRPSRLVRVTVNPTTMIADPNSLMVLLGSNSLWQYTSRPDVDSNGDRSIPPSGIVNGTTITAPSELIEFGTQDNDPDRPGLQNGNIRDYLATDSNSHTIGQVVFGPDGYLYVTNGDGTSYNFADPRSVRVQDINNLSGKMLRIDPITGQGLPDNPFYNGDPNSNQSKVFYYGIRNSYRFTFDPVTRLPVMGDVGWNSWEEINTGPAGSNFGWPYFEGPHRTASYRDLPQAIAFYNNGNRNNPDDSPAVFPLLSRSHGAPDNDSAVTVGDFYNANTLMFGDVRNGTLYAATLDSARRITAVRVFDSGVPYVVDMEMGPDNRLYGVDLVRGVIYRWDPA
ncbi:DUF4347 domain-containing protein [Thermoleptolyngbya sp. C42_A2020_037]|uniref:DUF4347 domain-containing protein n=1 Tax=Thermoleptolyngbya sp. C42_A2020_037 TaxID=2747799 RepID=UPI0019EE1C29|nr:DUF4347 domain-containing protein [Thermoleptolyngbya sp. C42_A2020_037]MBF2085060.1 DUF4347 domain-containing protein [Thermoleptolyngbya sp. C42_A2020_037]